MQLQPLCRTQTDLIANISTSGITRNRHPHGEIVDWNTHSKCSWGERLYIPWRIPWHKEKKNRKAGEKHAACGEAFEQAGYFFPDRKQQLHFYKNDRQDCTRYLKPPPFQFYDVNTEILKFNSSVKISDSIFMEVLFCPQMQCILQKWQI